MAVNVSQFVSQGLDAVHIAARGATGYMAGFAKLTAANVGLGSGMRRMRGSLTAPSPLPQRELINVRGDNTNIAKFDRESADTNEGTLEMSVIDIDVENFLTGRTLFTLGDWDFGLSGESSSTSIDTMLLMQRQSQSQETGSLNSNGWDNLIALSSTITPLGDDQMADNEAGGSSYASTFKRSLVFPHVATLASGFIKSDGYFLRTFTENPLMLHCFVGNGVLTAFVVDYAPVSVVKTQAFNAVTGAALTVSSVTASTKTITLSAAPASGVIVVTYYEIASL